MTSPTAEQTSVVYVRDNNDKNYTVDSVVPPPDFAGIMDTVEQQLAEAIESDTQPNLRDLALNLIGRAKREIMADVLVKLLVLFSESDNVKLDTEVLIAASGLPLRDVPDSEIAKSFGMTRQAFGARKKALMKKLDLAPPLHSKSLAACAEYTLTNRKNAQL